MPPGQRRLSNRTEVRTRLILAKGGPYDAWPKAASLRGLELLITERQLEMTEIYTIELVIKSFLNLRSTSFTARPSGDYGDWATDV